MHTPDKIQTTYADKGYAGAPTRGFLALNKIKDGIMRKDNINAKLTELEIQRNKARPLHNPDKTSLVSIRSCAVYCNNIIQNVV